MMLRIRTLLVVTVRAVPPNLVGIPGLPGSACMWSGTWQSGHFVISISNVSYQLRLPPTINILHTTTPQMVFKYSSVDLEVTATFECMRASLGLQTPCSMKACGPDRLLS